MKSTKLVLTYLAFVLVTIALVGVTMAAFVDKGKVLGSTFSVGSSDLKLLLDLAHGTESSNLNDELQGPSFNGINSTWSKDYMLKIYNNGTSQMQLSSNSNYLTANDPDELRSVIYVEPFDWNDLNTNGLVDIDELGTSYGKKTITKWKTEGYSLGTIEQGAIRGFVLRFSTENLSDTKQGKSGLIDFEFDSISQ